MVSLKQGHNRASQGDDDEDLIRRMYQKTPPHLINDEQKELLKDIPAHFVRRAWYNLAHMLLNDNALIAVMGCGNGMLTYTMAVLKPNLQFVGIDSDKDAINFARKNYRLPNTEFMQGDISRINLGPESVDAIINNRVLYEIYSNHAYSDLCVTRALEHHFSLLKADGTMFIQDYVMPEPGQFVLMEFPDKPGLSEDFNDFTNAELLEWYSEQARSHDEYSGFFLEELPPRFPKTRLFRLPYKWAYEFMVRKHDRNLWRNELDKEYAFFTERDFRKNLKSLGGRVLYTAKQWDEKFIAENFDGQFNLYNESGVTLSYPPTSLVVLVRKINHKHSLRLSERRRSKKPTGELQISSMRNKDNGELIDIISRAEASADVLPYRIDEANQSL
ncbi:MAG: methyltransferase domain-containing protein, partial [Pseudomonadota bacterium]|nr:methyltransferase domain-containing protein [Pseudomonadota bacterium]